MKLSRFWGIFSLVLILVFLLSAGVALAKGKPEQPKLGTSIVGYKTVDICVSDPTEGNPNGTQWLFSGVIAVGNVGDNATQGLQIKDCIQYKPYDSKGKFICLEPDYCIVIYPSEQIPAGEVAIFPYNITGAPILDAYIRNSVWITITNQSSSIGTPKGPNPKATYTGTLPPPSCNIEKVCVNATPVWSEGYSPDAQFFNLVDESLNPVTWQNILNIVDPTNPYFILAQQYIIAVLNGANGAYVPQGVQDTIDLAATWFGMSTPDTCSTANCSEQVLWAKVLKTYNTGSYPNGPVACPSE